MTGTVGCHILTLKRIGSFSKNTLVNKHIPKIKIKNEFQPPWFDSDCYEACKEKEKLRRKYKRTNSDTDGIKFKVARKDFKNLVSQKMNDNLLKSNDSAIIIKKFWSHLKSDSKSLRIPESINYNGTIRNDPKGQAELFNTYFYDQFTQKSKYNIAIDLKENDNFEININRKLVHEYLSDLNPNKAPGPDGIHARILKVCASNLDHPLSLLFNMSYESGSIPSDWKNANVVPVFKKGSKGNAEYYRHISLTCITMKIFEKIIKMK